MCTSLRVESPDSPHSWPRTPDYSNPIYQLYDIQQCQMGFELIFSQSHDQLVNAVTENSLLKTEYDLVIHKEHLKQREMAKCILSYLNLALPV